MKSGACAVLVVAALSHAAAARPSAHYNLYAIRPSSVFGKLGLTNGDTIARINNVDLTSADQALEIYTKLRETRSLTVEIMRRGATLTLTCTIK